ncbi:hypothetical protein CDO44_17180 [Pigmentiphaga sp. NML080357]|uniref:branched-chain amino acid ABC transporter permease n=1 Tax=Pigmentiphaga sp. NML080357 TaxID=2008675 RepID=UPI000B408134|nr:branched-chain amino acid ABC transporter permease [Pigmentiphaga sp. NML080357]OVZ57497.1 hypothetical protein CDO44_17180 [Pigmentiphaga sp. NML080357]
MNSSRFFYLAATGMFLLAALAPFVYSGEYFYFAAYSVLQLILMATAWNLLGGFTGYVNFGASAFFATGTYTSIVMVKLMAAPLLACMLAAAAAAALLGAMVGYLTLRLRGVYFSIATLALSVVLFTLVINWEFVGGARGAYVIMVDALPPGYATPIQLLCAVLALQALAGVALARAVQRSPLGSGLAAIRDDEVASEALGVPTLKMKIIVTSLSGGLMGLAGSTFPHFLNYVEPTAAFSLTLSINSIAVPLIGGMHSWLGPVVGGLLLGSLLQYTTVALSPDWNLIIVGAALLVCVTVAPQGILGAVEVLLRRKRNRS